MEDCENWVYLRYFASFRGEMTDSQLKSGIESVVIKWVHQVEEVLRQDSDDIASPDHFPLPLQELTFWIKRKDNLAHIAEQLKDCKVSFFRCNNNRNCLAIYFSFILNILHIVFKKVTNF